MDPGARAGKSNIFLEVRCLEVGYIPRTSGGRMKDIYLGHLDRGNIMITDLAHLRRMSKQALLYNSYFHTFGIYLEILRLFVKTILF